MQSSNDEQRAVQRLPYRKPALRSISLAVDQVLGTGCKAQTSNYSTNLAGQYPCVFYNCALVEGS